MNRDSLIHFECKAHWDIGFHLNIALGIVVQRDSKILMDWDFCMKLSIQPNFDNIVIFASASSCLGNTMLAG